MRVLLCVSLAALAFNPGYAQPMQPASAAKQIFERDWMLMNWALKHFDNDRDVLLSPAETERAAAEFRNMADADGDGRVTPQEYRAARDFIIARY